MASDHDVMELWSNGPDPHVRAIKGQVEEELLIKLGAKREVVNSLIKIFSTFCRWLLYDLFVLSVVSHI